MPLDKPLTGVETDIGSNPKGVSPMRKSAVIIGSLIATAAISVPVVAAFQDEAAAPALPGIPDKSRVEAGTYALDPAHTQVVWEVSHFGFNPYTGIFGDVTGTMTLDPANPSAASINIIIPIGKVATNSEGLTKHLKTPDFFDVENNPTATFKSTKIEIDEKSDEAEITGDLTIRGVTKSVTLDAKFVGAGENPFSKKKTVGFVAETSVKRSDFGVNYGIPIVSDEVELNISVAFEKVSEPLGK